MEHQKTSLDMDDKFTMKSLQLSVNPKICAYGALMLQFKSYNNLTLTQKDSI